MEPNVSHNEVAPHEKKLSLTVVYNGAKFQDAEPATAAVESLFAKAVQHFEVQGNRANLGLFLPGSQTPLDLNASFAAQGIPDGATLSLNPRRVGNG